MAPKRAGFKPGETVPSSGQYRVVFADGSTGDEITAVEGEPFPPAEKGARFELVDATDHAGDAAPVDYLALAAQYAEAGAAAAGPGPDGGGEGDLAVQRAIAYALLGLLCVELDAARPAEPEE